MNARPAQVDGILNMDKPYEMTSMELVRRVKRSTRQKRVGHAGTLDPIATGVVAVCFGQATRVMEYLVNGTKEYRAGIALGVETDTYDAFGEVTREDDASGVTLEEIAKALEGFMGVTEQVPPMYSALKREGKRLYELARAGVEVERQPRRVEVHSLKLLSWSPPVAMVEVACGRGFYMRSLAYDLGRKLGCGGHLKSLVRLRSGPFRVESALSLSELERMCADPPEEDWREALHAPDAVLYNLRTAVLGKRLEGMVRNGMALPAGLRVPLARPDEQCRAYSVDGRFLGVLKFDGASRQWKPEKVFSLTYSDGGPV